MIIPYGGTETGVSYILLSLHTILQETWVEDLASVALHLMSANQKEGTCLPDRAFLFYLVLWMTFSNTWASPRHSCSCWPTEEWTSLSMCHHRETMDSFLAACLHIDGEIRKVQSKASSTPAPDKAIDDPLRRLGGSNTHETRAWRANTH